MFGSGGSALIAKTFGEGDPQKANRQFSLLVYFSLALSFVLAVVGIIFIEDIALLLGSSEIMLADCVLYGRIILVALPAYVLQFEFQTLFITAEKPQLGFIMTVISGVLNMVLDALLVLLLPYEFKLIGAAIATATARFVGGVIPLVYFLRKTTAYLDFKKQSLTARQLFRRVPTAHLNL